MPTAPARPDVRPDPAPGAASVAPRPADPSALPPRVRWTRRALAAAASLLTVALLGQLFTAGLAVFVGPGWWARHRDWVHTFEWLSPVAVVLAHVGRVPRAAKVLAWLTVALLWLQYTTADLRLVPGRQAWAALHPVNAVLLFWTASELARRAWRAARG